MAMLACVLWIGFGFVACVIAFQQNVSHRNYEPYAAIICAAVIEIPFALLMCLGAFRMKAYRSRPLALTTAILALVPFGPTLYFGMPLAIWALVLLRRADVVAAFANRAAGDRPISAPTDPAQIARGTTVPPMSS